LKKEISMLALQRSLLVLVLSTMACDGSTEEGPLVSLSSVTSSYASCSALSASDASFVITNPGASPLELMGIDFDSASSGGSLAFVDDASVPADTSSTWTCHGGLTGGTSAGTEATSATLHFMTIGGEHGQIEASGTHTTFVLFDNCDTGLPDRETRPCTIAP
jgi:hypothetical protein